MLSGYVFLLHLHSDNCKRKRKIKKEVVLCDEIDDCSNNEKKFSVPKK